MSEPESGQPPEPSAEPAGERPPADAPGGQEQMSEEEMQRRLEEQLRQIRVQDVVAESAVSIINLTARRIGKADERDLEQARVGIEAVRALVGLVEGELAGQLRSALSELQVLYAREAGGPPAGGETGGAGATGGAPPDPAAGTGQQGRGEPPPRLWTPGR